MYIGYIYIVPSVYVYRVYIYIVPSVYVYRSVCTEAYRLFLSHKFIFINYIHVHVHLQ